MLRCHRGPLQGLQQMISVVAGGQRVEAGSPLMQVAALASVHLSGQICPPPPPLILPLALQADLHPPQDLQCLSKPSSPAAGWAE